MKRPGFTLIELLIVASVFSLTLLVGTTVFISVQARQNEILRRQRLVADGRYLLETIARTARTEAVDYRYYYTDGQTDANSLSGPAYPATTLVTRNEVNDQTCFRLDSVTQTIQLSADCQTNPSWESITSPDIRVVYFRIYIKPGSNPYAPAPQSTADCRDNPAGPPRETFNPPLTYNGFDVANGTCRCRVGQPNDCFAGQQCASALANQSIDGNGQGLCSDHVTQTCYCRNANIQPQVTIYMITQSKNTPVSTLSQVTLQTTVISRAYGR